MRVTPRNRNERHRWRSSAIAFARKRDIVSAEWLAIQIANASARGSVCGNVSDTVVPSLAAITLSELETQSQ